MTEITYTEYWAEISAIAADLCAEAFAEKDNDRERAREHIFDRSLHEVIDGHQWIIYYTYNLEVISCSDNENYLLDNFGAEGLAASLEKGSIHDVLTAVAFWAMHADVSDRIEAALDAEQQKHV